MKYAIIVTESTKYIVEAESHDQAEGIIHSAWCDGTMHTECITQGDTDVEFEQAGLNA